MGDGSVTEAKVGKTGGATGGAGCAVLDSRFAALTPVVASSLPAALASARSAEERRQVTHGFSSGLQTSQLVGAAAVLLGGLLAAALLHRAERAGGNGENTDAEMAVAR